jgi:hypothetical protein
MSKVIKMKDKISLAVGEFYSRPAQVFHHGGHFLASIFPVLTR